VGQASLSERRPTNAPRMFVRGSFFVLVLAVIVAIG
jgi:hypothetical protein